jgi:hypothetical protein
MKRLYTLDLRSYLFRSPTIPNVLWKLEYLRHLLVEYSSVSGSINRVDTIRNLETLRWIRANNLISNDTMFKLTNLRKLGMFFDRTEEVEVEKILTRSGTFQTHELLDCLVIRTHMIYCVIVC